MLGLTAIEPQLGFNWVLPCQLPLQGGQGVLERFSDKPSLLIGDRIEGLDGLRLRPGVNCTQPRLARSAARAVSRLARAENSPIAHSAFAICSREGFIARSGVIASHAAFVEDSGRRRPGGRVFAPSRSRGKTPGSGSV